MVGNGISERGVGNFFQRGILNTLFLPWVIWFILGALFFCIFYQGWFKYLSFSPQSKLATIPPEDRALFLEEFRDVLRSDFGFTLLGVKPLSLEEFGITDLNKDPKKKQRFIHWLKSLFDNSPRFSIRFLYFNDRDGDVYGVYLIDRQAFKELHEDPDAPFDCGAEKIGMLFGYGKENAQFFVRFADLNSCFRKKPVVRKPHLFDPIRERVEKRYHAAYVPFTIEPPINPQFTSLEEEWKWMVQNEHPYEEWDKLPFWISKPAFVSKKSEETDKILKNFNNGATQLGAILHDDCWFERVLEIIEAK